MEKMNDIPPEEKNEKPKLGINIFRHGQAKYEQGVVPVEAAQDLTEKGIEDVKKNAAELAELITPDEEVEIWASPTGRTLHTAKLIAETLAAKGRQLRRKGDAEESGIKVFPQLAEVKNFSWKLFSPLVSGGEVDLAGKKFMVDKQLTNPEDVNYQIYFNEDRIKEIPSEVKAQFPEEYVQAIEGFEKFISATSRIMKPLSRLAKTGDKQYRVIIVTHDALTGFIANVFTGGDQGGVNPGEFINLERENDKLVATQVGETKTGDRDTDVVEAFNRRKEAGE
jgi:broad specificity phosphatase PhoE